MSVEQLRPPQEAVGQDVRRPVQEKLSRGEAQMVALGIQPAMIDEETAAAICGMTRARFCALCPIPGQRMGRKTLRPIDLVKNWSVHFWAEATGYPLGDCENDAEADDDWARHLPDGNPEEITGGLNGAAH